MDGNGGKIWVENLATTMRLLVTPAEVGFAGSSVKCPAKLANPALAGTCTCTGYGQGCSRVTDVNGIKHVTAAGAAAALTVPMITQVANHLAAFGSFKASDLVLVWGGNNDVFIQFGVFGAKAAAIQANAGAGKVTADEANKQLYDAQTKAQTDVKTAALELAALVKSQILAKGGKYVAVFNLQDSSLTPFGSTLSKDANHVLTTLVDTFNLWLREGLTDLPVQWVDQNVLGKNIYANPAKYGLTNNPKPACDADKIKTLTRDAVTDGSSLFCNATPGMGYNSLRAGADINTWLFADGVHPTVGGHKVISDNVTTQLRAFGWL